MLIEYKIEGAEVTRIILPEGVPVEDALEILGVDKNKVKVTVVGIT